jgi:hypothetical protein
MKARHTTLHHTQTHYTTSHVITSHLCTAHYITPHHTYTHYTHYTSRPGILIASVSGSSTSCALKAKRREWRREERRIIQCIVIRAAVTEDCQGTGIGLISSHHITHITPHRITHTTPLLTGNMR